MGACHLAEQSFGLFPQLGRGGQGEYVNLLFEPSQGLGLKFQRLARFVLLGLIGWLPTPNSKLSQIQHQGVAIAFGRADSGKISLLLLTQQLCLPRDLESLFHGSLGIAFELCLRTSSCLFRSRIQCWKSNKREEVVLGWHGCWAIS